MADVLAKTTVPHLINNFFERVKILSFFCVLSFSQNCAASSSNTRYNIIYDSSTATSACRYPDMLFNWKELAKSNFRAEHILVLGPGVDLQKLSMEGEQYYSVTQLHEIAGIFADATTTVVDKNARVISVIRDGISNYTGSRFIASRFTLPNKNNFNYKNGYICKKKDENSLEILKELVFGSPEVLDPNLFELEQIDFLDFEFPQEKYDLIVATNCLMFPLVESQDIDEKERNVKDLFTKIYMSLRKGGVLYIDNATFEHWKNVFNISVKKGLFEVNNISFNAAKIRSSSSNKSIIRTSNSSDLRSSDGRLIATSDDIIRVQRLD